MFEVSFKIKDIAVTIKDKQFVCAISKDEAILIVRMLHRLSGVNARKYAAKKL